MSTTSITPTTPTKTISLFGATGGTGLETLKLLLASSYHVNVLVRTPSKLSSLQNKYPSTLHIITGDIRSPASIKQTLTHPNNTIASIIISAIGMVFRREGLGLKSRDPTICADGTKAVLAGLKELENAGLWSEQGGPRIVLLSTTGISSKGRDIPIGMIPFYHWILKVPHKDKQVMEQMMVGGEGKGRRWVLVRPSFLNDGEGKGVGSVRVGWEVMGEREGEGGERKSVDRREGNKDKMEIGYVISRADVGAWIVEECVKGDGKKWEGKAVSLTH